MRADSPRSPDRLPPGWLGQAETKQLVLAELAQRTARRTRRRRALAGGAAALALAVASAAFTWHRGADAPPGTAATAALPAPARETLPDGSVVERKGDAAYAVEFGATVRRVVLTRGTAHFEVARNPARPFVVVAGEVSVRAVGTAFSVEYRADRIEVLVIEGRVAVAPGSAPATPVDAGHGVRVAPAAGPEAPASVQPIGAAELEAALAWRVRPVEFSGTPLAEAIAILNRHNRVQFSLADPALARIRLSGVLRADQTAGVLRLLEDEFGVRAERRGDTEIVLHRSK
jgi:transmembrane sensor